MISIQTELILMIKIVTHGNWRVLVDKYNYGHCAGGWGVFPLLWSRFHPLLHFFVLHLESTNYKIRNLLELSALAINAT